MVVRVPATASKYCFVESGAVPAIPFSVPRFVGITGSKLGRLRVTTASFGRKTNYHPSVTRRCGYYSKVAFIDLYLHNHSRNEYGRLMTELSSILASSS